MDAEPRFLVARMGSIYLQDSQEESRHPKDSFGIEGKTGPSFKAKDLDDNDDNIDDGKVYLWKKRPYTSSTLTQRAQPLKWLREGRNFVQEKCS